MPPSTNNTTGQDDIWQYIVYVILVFVVFYGVTHFYNSHRDVFNAVPFAIAFAILQTVHVIGVDTWVSDPQVGQILAIVDWSSPGDYDFAQTKFIMAKAGAYLRWPVALVIVLLAIYVFKTPTLATYTRRFDIWSLVERNAHYYPCMRPIVNHKKRFGRTILEEPMDGGAWPMARTVLQFAVQHKLLVGSDGKPIPREWLLTDDGIGNERSPLLKPGANENVQLDWDRARLVFTNQLGTSFEGIDKLPNYRKGLAAAFMAFVAGYKDDGQDLLDYMSTSFVEPEPGPDMIGRMKLDIGNADDLITKYKDHIYVKDAIQYHDTFEITYLCALYRAVIAVLSCSQFIWLRPVDPLLWRALNMMGERTYWAESLAVGIHMEIEDKLERSIPVANMDWVILSFEYALRETGFLPWQVKRARLPENMT